MTFTLLHPALADMAFLPPGEEENHFPLPLKKWIMAELFQSAIQLKHLLSLLEFYSEPEKQ